MNNEEIVEFIEDITKHKTIIKGITNIVNDDSYYMVKDNDFWIVAGFLDNDSIKLSFEDIDINVEREGVYEYTAIIYHYRGYDEPSEIYIDYIDFRFIETFQERDREEKLNKILFQDFDLFSKSF
jgi:hypothetical protein